MFLIAKVLDFKTALRIYSRLFLVYFNTNKVVKVGFKLKRLVERPKKKQRSGWLIISTRGYKSVF